MNRSLFDAPAPVSKTETAPAPRPDFRNFGRDVLRVIQHSIGPFKWLAGDVGEKPHVIVQLTSGEYVMRYLDGTEIGPLTSFSAEDVERNLQQRRWKVVQG